MRFDNQGRLWVSTLPSYPHYKPGDDRPNDKILIYEDTNGDGENDNFGPKVQLKQQLGIGVLYKF